MTDSGKLVDCADGTERFEAPKNECPACPTGKVHKKGSFELSAGRCIDCPDASRFSANGMDCDQYSCPATATTNHEMVVNSNPKVGVGIAASSFIGALSGHYTFSTDSTIRTWSKYVDKEGCQTTGACSYNQNPTEFCSTCATSYELNEDFTITTCFKWRYEAPAQLMWNGAVYESTNGYKCTTDSTNVPASATANQKCVNGRDGDGYTYCFNEHNGHHGNVAGTPGACGVGGGPNANSCICTRKQSIGDAGAPDTYTQIVGRGSAVGSKNYGIYVNLYQGYISGQVGNACGTMTTCSGSPSTCTKCSNGLDSAGVLKEVKNNATYATDLKTNWGDWRRVTLSFQKSGNMDLYVTQNGYTDKVGTTTTDGSDLGTDAVRRNAWLTLGGQVMNDDGNFGVFPGEIKGTHIYKTALTQAEVETSGKYCSADWSCE
jgi:hypothetical protein